MGPGRGTGTAARWRPWGLCRGGGQLAAGRRGGHRQGRSWPSSCGGRWAIGPDRAGQGDADGARGLSSAAAFARLWTTARAVGRTVGELAGVVLAGGSLPRHRSPTRRARTIRGSRGGSRRRLVVVHCRACRSVPGLVFQGWPSCLRPSLASLMVLPPSRQDVARAGGCPMKQPLTVCAGERRASAGCSAGSPRSLMPIRSVDVRPALGGGVSVTRPRMAPTSALASTAAAQIRRIRLGPSPWRAPDGRCVRGRPPWPRRAR
jgi:hypothetical protein